MTAYSAPKRLKARAALTPPAFASAPGRAGLRGAYAFAPVFASCASISMRMRRWVGMLAFAASALSVESRAAGRRRLIGRPRGWPAVARTLDARKVAAPLALSPPPFDPHPALRATFFRMGEGRSRGDFGGFRRHLLQCPFPIRRRLARPQGWRAAAKNVGRKRRRGAVGALASIAVPSSGAPRHLLPDGLACAHIRFADESNTFFANIA